MICPKCGSVALVKKGYCDQCGYDLSVKKEAFKLAHYYYNKGLAKAKLRDISGAIDMLKRSIELEKDFVNARNLLGLCYFEIGEVALAIKEWIVSKNLREYNPLADKYLGIIQNNPAKLKNYRRAIEKYNNGLKLVKSGGYDLALIQLKRAVTLNPDYVKAWQLLALVYMYSEDFEKARKCLKRSLKTDIANPKSLRYMKEIRDERYKKVTGQVELSEPKPEDRDARVILDGKPAENIKPQYSYKENTGEYKGFLCLMLGVLLGIMVVYFLVVPGIKQSLKQDYLSDQKKNGDQMTQYLAKMESLEKENSSLLNKLEFTEIEASGLSEKVDAITNEKHYANVVSMFKFYLDISGKDGGASELDMYLLKQRIDKITASELEQGDAKALYDIVLAKYPNVLEAKVSGNLLFDSGKAYYDGNKFEEAKELFAYCYNEFPDHEDNLYYYAATFQMLKDEANALKYYKEYANKFPSGVYIKTVEEWIAAKEQ